jgi:ribosomal protein S18 acetylase RimI-like enzyme
MEIIYRPAVDTDFEFLYALHEAAMRVYVEETFGSWDETFQRAYFRQHFTPAEVNILQVEGQDVGMLRVQERTEETFLAGFEILPRWQRRGIGTRVLRALVADAAGRGKPVALKVLKTNIAARSLYQRLGFGVTGENETHYIMANERAAG